jgi:hypothetical protein
VERVHNIWKKKRDSDEEDDWALEEVLVLLCEEHFEELDEDGW